MKACGQQHNWHDTNKNYQSATEDILKLEIWGKAQCESARRPKSDWGKLEGGG